MRRKLRSGVSRLRTQAVVRAMGVGSEAAIGCQRGPAGPSGVPAIAGVKRASTARTVPSAPTISSDSARTYALSMRARSIRPAMVSPHGAPPATARRRAALAAWS